METKMVSKPAFVAFDLDGTLISSEEIWVAAEEAVLDVRGKKHLYSREMISDLVGVGISHFAREFKVRFDLPEDVDLIMNELMEQFCNLFAQYAQLRSGVVDALSAAKSLNVPLAIVSSSHLHIIQAAVAKFNHLSDAFQPHLLFSAQFVPAAKPSPDVYINAREVVLGQVDPAACIAVEDSENGAKAAVAAGYTTLIVPENTDEETMRKMRAISPLVFEDGLFGVAKWLEKHVC